MAFRDLVHSRTAAVLTGAAVLVTVAGVGGAVAANTVGSADIRDGAVRTADIHDRAVTSA